MQEKVSKLENQEKAMAGNIEDLKTLLHKINQNGEDKVACLKQENVSEPLPPHNIWLLL